MKNIFKFLLGLSLLLIYSCDDYEPTMFNSSNGTFLSFSQNIYTLPVVRDADGSVELVLNSSTTSPVDRVYNLEIIPEETTANPATYTFPSTITIPANSYQGFATVTGVDNNLVDDIPDPLVFRISNLTNEFMDTNQILINIVEVCPLAPGTDFLGDYTVTQLSAGSLGEPIMQGVVTLSGTGFERSFDAAPYPTLGSFTKVKFTFSLNCGNTLLARQISAGVGCGGNIIQFNVALTQGTYNPNNDNSFTLKVLENTTSSCGAPPAETTLRFTKL